MGHPAPSPRLPPGSPPALSCFPASPSPSLRGFSLLQSSSAPRVLLHQHGPSTRGAAAACRGAGSGATGWGGAGRGASGAGPGHTPLLGGTSSHGHAVAQSGRQMPPKPARGWEAGVGGWGGGCPSPLRDPGVVCQCFQHCVAPPRAHRAARHSTACPTDVPRLQPTASTRDLGSGSWHPTAGGAGTHLGRGTAPCGPNPGCPLPPGPAALQLEPGRDAAGCAAPSPALPAPPKQPLSKGWSSKILTRAPSVYHTVNLGFQQLYDAAGRWERTKRCSS